MGREAETTITIGKRSFRAKVLLESEEVVIRGPDRRKLPFRSIKNASQKDGALTLETETERIVIALGADAPKWLDKIKNPKGRIEKLGVKPGMCVGIVGEADADFLAELDACGVTRRARGCDAMFVFCKSVEDLRRIEGLKAKIDPDGAVWIVRPKGKDGVSEREVMAAGKAAGMVDVKVVGFSSTHTAEKFVIPVAARR